MTDMCCSNFNAKKFKFKAKFNHKMIGSYAKKDEEFDYFVDLIIPSLHKKNNFMLSLKHKTCLVNIPEFDCERTKHQIFNLMSFYSFSIDILHST